MCACVCAITALAPAMCTIKEKFITFNDESNRAHFTAIITSFFVVAACAFLFGLSFCRSRDREKEHFCGFGSRYLFTPDGEKLIMRSWRFIEVLILIIV